MNRRAVLCGVAAALCGSALAGCVSPGGDRGDGTSRAGGGTGAGGTGGEDESTVVPSDDGTAYTHGRATGNRVAAGRGALPEVDPVDVSLDGTPAWLVAAPVPGGSLWVVALADGRLVAVRLTADGAESATVAPGSLPAGTPPTLVHGGDGGTAGDDGRRPQVLVPPTDASRLSAPVPVGDHVAAVGADGDVLVSRDGERTARFGVDALPDARPVVADGRVAVLAGATDRYAHGALGDDLEAGAVAVVDPAAGTAGTIETPGNAVIEGVAPIWTDWGPGAEPVLVVTLSDPEAGARVGTVAPDGRWLATGPAIGSGFRWRHQLAVAPFGGRRELAVVRTPHVGGTVEFYRHRGDRLTREATLPGYSSHAFGSRNLDTARAADADGDGRVELLVPTDDRRRLGGIRRTASGATAAWHVPVGAPTATNLATVTRSGRLAVGVGRADGTLRVWPAP